MFNSSINVKLKSIFDKLYLSRNLFNKMKNLLSEIEEGSYTYDVLLERSENILNTINTVLDNLESLNEYNDKIQTLSNENDSYNSHFNSIMSELMDFYESAITDNIITTIQSMRNATIALDLDYKDSTGINVNEYGEFISEKEDKFNSFIPTDDYFAWNTVTKDKSVLSSNNIIIGYDTEKIDPLETDSSDSYSGGVNSKKFSHSPTIFDILINVEGSGFSLASINSKTGEVYTRIEDDYKLEAHVGSNKIYHNGEYKTVNEILTTKPEPGLLLSIREPRCSNISIRRHGEMGKNSPTKFYSLLWRSGDSVRFSDDKTRVYNEGPTTL